MLGFYCFAGGVGRYRRLPEGLGAKLLPIYQSPHHAKYKVCIILGAIEGFPFYRRYVKKQINQQKHPPEPQQRGLHGKYDYVWHAGVREARRSMGAGIFFWASIKSKAMKAHCGAHLCYNPL